MRDALSIVEAMTLEEKVAQMFVVGFNATELPERYEQLITQRAIGGVILFTRNVKSPAQVRALTGAIQAAGRASRQGLPLAIAIDQEGGTVVRMAETDGFTHMPGNMALGAADDETLTYRAARVQAAELRAIGVNWNYAPVLDVNNNGLNPVIGVRSYGSSPDLVSRHGLAALRGYQAGGVAPCGKHFPGHGDTTVDSHLALPVIPHSRERLEAVEFAPFRAAVKAGIDSIMTAHVFFPALEPNPGLPATLSHNVLTGLLRSEMGFEGVICTDCLEMKAIADNHSPEETVLTAVEAGADALLISHTWEKQVAMLEALTAAVKAGRVSEEQVTQSALRMIQMKLARKMDEEFSGATGTPEHLAVARDAARKAVTVVRGAEYLPLRGKVTLVLPRVTWFAQVEDSRTVLSALLTTLAQTGLEIDVIDCPLNMAGHDAAELARQVGPGGTVVFGAAAAGRHPQQAEFSARLTQEGCRVIVLARRMPYDLSHFPAAVAQIAAYDDSPAMQQAVAELLTGRLQPTGKLPVELN